MNYITLGSNGFAQLGDPDYEIKLKSELEVLLPLYRSKFPIPEKLNGLMRFSTKRFSHDFGVYTEIVLYLDSYLDDLQNSESEEDLALFDSFVEFANEAESFDVETDIITSMIKSQYLNSIDISKAEHLSLVGGTA